MNLLVSCGLTIYRASSSMGWESNRCSLAADSTNDALLSSQQRDTPSLLGGYNTLSVAELKATFGVLP